MAKVKKEEATLKVDDKSYIIAELPDRAKKHLMNVQVVDNEIKRLEMQLAIAQTARSAYQQALVGSLPK
ncbi:MAG: hypothetical protein HGA59_10415 [Chlorobiaceae bacterium]|jgi:hypothetical protein|nr:hypothetical protein [Chlorobiaceae bacterium]